MDEIYVKLTEERLNDLFLDASYKCKNELAEELDEIIQLKTSVLVPFSKLAEWNSILEGK